MTTNSFSSSGQCLCGGVRFQATAESAQVGLCHCKMCRRWGGGLPLAVVQAQVSLTADKTLSWWKSSPWGERGFCSVCGSSLFSRNQSGGNNIWAVSAGALDDVAGLTLLQHIFYDDKAPFYEFADKTPRYSGVEFIAKLFQTFRGQYGEDFLQPALAQLRQHSGDTVADEVEKLISAQ